MDPIHNPEVISVGDLVKEHTKHSKRRVGLVREVISNYYLDIKWLDGSVDKRHRNKYEVTKFIEGEYHDILQDYIQGKRW
jgi:hypothetical protein|tara:strand:+ start:75 stop:314 length:240 start_codon:yes stop_codon:yes gene_type:complete